MQPAWIRWITQCFACMFAIAASAIIPAGVLSAGELFFSYHGSADTDRYFAMRPASDGGVIAVGQVYFSGSGHGDNLLVKHSSTGSIQWARLVGGPGNEWVTDVIETSDGGFICTGRTGSYNPDMDLFLFKCDSGGNLLWYRRMGGGQR